MTQVTIKAGHFRELLETFSFPAGSQRLFPILPLRFTDKGIECTVSNDEKTAVIIAHWAPDPYVIEDPSDDPIYCLADDLLPILGRFNQDDILTVTIDGTMTFTGPTKEFIHYPESELNAHIPASLPTFEDGKMIVKEVPCNAFLSFDASAFHDMLEDAKVLSVDVYPIELGDKTLTKLGSTESKKDSATAHIKGQFDGEPINFILGAELVYVMKNMKGDMTLQTRPGTVVCFTKKTSKPAGVVHTLIAPKVVA